ncbi:hypothetical protein FPV67DRAFT_1449244 [Lyophyllum atratum]|nr:hypothetical protein FPV67DRAFT_1449244 [Lyophyllum atratum]
MDSFTGTYLSCYLLAKSIAGMMYSPPAQALPDILSPPSAVIPGKDEFFPVSPNWTAVRSAEYSLGEQVSSDAPYCQPTVHGTDLRQQTFPNVSYSRHSQNATWVPFTYDADGNADSLACPPEGLEIKGLADRLLMLTFGQQHYQKSQRSVRFGRSYTLAATIEKGHAMGRVVPVVQIGYPYAKARIGELLEVIHNLFRLVMPHMLSKFEMAISEKFNNDAQDDMTCLTFFVMFVSHPHSGATPSSLQLHFDDESIETMCAINAQYPYASKNFFTQHGKHLLGPISDAETRLALEHIFNFTNVLTANLPHPVVLPNCCKHKRSTMPSRSNNEGDNGQSESKDREQSDAREDSDREEPEYKVQVKWVNYSKHYNEWHIASELAKVQGLLDEYIAKNPNGSISLQPQPER